MRTVRLVTIVLMALAAGPAWAQSPDALSADRLKRAVQQALPPESARPFTARQAANKVEPLLPIDTLIQPLLDKLPLQLIPQLLRTEQRLTLQVDNYTVKPHVGLHEVEIVVTRPLR